MEFLSAFPDVVWPAVPGPRALGTLSLLFQLEQSQWWSTSELLSAQFRQLRQLLRHAYRTVPYYAQRADAARFAQDFTLDLECFRLIPILERSMVQEAGELLHSQSPPELHGRISAAMTSGSTGKPIRSLSTELSRAMWRVLTLRDHLWHRRDFSGALAVIRDTELGSDCEGTSHDNWGSATRGVVRTGPAAMMTTRSSVSEQAAWLDRLQPKYLLAYPSNVKALAAHCRDHGIALSALSEVRTFGEVLDKECVRLVAENWGAKVVDTYSAQEAGYLALQCPESGEYHVQSESVLVEVVRPDGTPCQPGEIGRVIVTTLLNFAMPLIRYEIGDFAEVGETCPCGRGLPTLRRILGRQRNMLTLPTGEQFWPTFAFGEPGVDLPPVRQFQLIQRSLVELEAIVVTPSLTAEDELRWTEYLHRTLGYPFRIRFTRADVIPHDASGKYEEFRSLTSSRDSAV